MDAFQNLKTLAEVSLKAAQYANENQVTVAIYQKACKEYGFGPALDIIQRGLDIKKVVSFDR